MLRARAGYRCARPTPSISSHLACNARPVLTHCQDVGDLEGHVDQPHAELERRLVHRARREGRGDGRRDAAMPPGDHLAALVEPRIDALDGDGMEDIVLPRPLHLDRRAELLREQCGFEGVIALRLPPNPPPSRVTLTVTFSSGIPSVLATSSRVPPGLCTGAQISALSPLTSATATGGSMATWARWGR